MEAEYLRVTDENSGGTGSEETAQGALEKALKTTIGEMRTALESLKVSHRPSRSFIVLLHPSSALYNLFFDRVGRDLLFGQLCLYPETGVTYEVDDACFNNTWNTDYSMVKLFGVVKFGFTMIHGGLTFVCSLLSSLGIADTGG